MADKNINVLCLDAGGMKGIYSLTVIEALQQQYKSSFNKTFDYYVGSSIGAVICTALAAGIPSSEISKDFYAFAKDFNQGHIHLIRQLHTWIDNRFEQRKMGDINLRLFLPVFNHSTRQATYFSNNEKHADILIADILKASCSDIRITEPHFISKTGHYFSDAGFFAYDPALFFIRSKQLQLSNKLKILSIGSGVIKNLSSDLSQGESFDIIYDSFLEEQFQTTALLFDTLSSSRDLQYLRISEFPQSILKQVSITDLVSMAQTRAQSLDPKMISVFFELYR